MSKIIKILLIFVLSLTKASDPPRCPHLTYEKSNFSKLIEIPRLRNGHCVAIATRNSFHLTTGFGVVNGTDCRESTENTIICRCSKCNVTDLLKAVENKGFAVGHVRDYVKNEITPSPYIRHRFYFTFLVLFLAGIAGGSYCCWNYPEENPEAFPNETIPPKTKGEQNWDRFMIFVQNWILATGGAAIVPSVFLFVCTTNPSLNDVDKTVCGSCGFVFLTLSMSALLIGQCQELTRNEETGYYDTGDIISLDATFLAGGGCALSISFVGYSNMAITFNAISASLGLVMFITNAIRSTSDKAKMNPGRPIIKDILLGAAVKAPTVRFKKGEESIDLDITLTQEDFDAMIE